MNGRIRAVANTFLVEEVTCKKTDVKTRAVPLMFLVFLLKVSVICALVVNIVCYSCSLVIDTFLLPCLGCCITGDMLLQCLCKTFLWGPNFLPLNFCWLALFFFSSF